MTIAWLLLGFPCLVVVVKKSWDQLPLKWPYITFWIWCFTRVVANGCQLHILFKRVCSFAAYSFWREVRQNRSLTPWPGLSSELDVLLNSLYLGGAKAELRRNSIFVKSPDEKYILKLLCHVFWRCLIQWTVLRNPCVLILILAKLFVLSLS